MRKLHLVLLFTITISRPALAQNVGIGTTSPTAQLHTTGTVKHEVMKGDDSRPVFADANGQLFTMVTAGNTFNNTTQYAIPDNGCISGSAVVSTISISGKPNPVPSSSICVQVNINHILTSQLILYLLSPDGSILELSNSINNAATTFNVAFSDLAATVISNAPIDGQVYRPTAAISNNCLLPTVTSFSAIGGGNIVPDGNWTLFVFDKTAGLVGTLKSWSISFDGQRLVDALSANNYIPVYNNGAFVKSNLFFEHQSGIIHVRSNSDPDAGIAFKDAATNNKWQITGANAPFLGSSRLEFYCRVGSSSVTPMKLDGEGKLNLDGRFHVSRNSIGGADPHLLLTQTSSDFTRLAFENYSTANKWTIGGKPATNNNDAVMTFYWDGIGADVFYLMGNGNAWVRGVLTQNSDARLKRNVLPLQTSLQKLQQLNGYHYYWKDAALDQTLQTGVMAQEVKKIFPELVKEDKKGILSVNYNGFVPHLIEAVKEQNKRCDELLRRTEAQEKELNEIKRQLAQLLQKK